MIEISGIVATDAVTFVSDCPHAPGHQVLLPSGCRFTPDVELRSKHYGEGSFVLGKMVRAWQVGNRWLAKFRFDTSDPRAVSIAEDILQFKSRFLSCGYYTKTESIHVVSPWSKVTIDGRTYAAGPDPIELVSEYIIREVSLADTPADRGCEIFSVREIETTTKQQAKPPTKKASITTPKLLPQSAGRMSAAPIQHGPTLYYR